MSVAVKKRHIEVRFGTRNPKLYIIPTSKAHSIQNLIEEYAIENKEIEWLDADEAFKHLDKKYTKAGALLQGYRIRDELTQVELAKKLKTSQPTIAAMETGSRPIGVAVAKKLAKLFDVDFRIFL